MTLAKYQKDIYVLLYTVLSNGTKKTNTYADNDVIMEDEM